MATLAEIDAELARRQKAPSIVDIDAELARRQQAEAEQQTDLDQVQPVTEAPEIEEKPQIGEPGGLIENIPPIGGAEALGTIASAIPAEIAAGLSGIVQSVNPFAEPGAGAQAVETVRDALTFIPRSAEGQKQLQQIAEILQPVGEAFETAEEFTGDIGFEAGGPVGGAAGAAVPTAIAELLGVGSVGRAARAIKSTDKAADAARQARRAQDSAEIERVKEVLGKETVDAVESAKPSTSVGADIGDIKNGEAPELQDYESILSNLKKKKIKESTIDAMPDSEILKAADDLGVDLNPDHYSNNRVFRELTQRLKDRPGSKLGAVEEKAIIDLGRRADELISDIGGDVDKSILDLKLKTGFDKTIAELEKQSDLAYKAVDDAIPRITKVKPLASRQYLNSILNDLGGDKSQLALSERRLLQIMDRNPTYAALDRIRKDVGSGFRKGMGPFKDDNSGTLKQVYRVLSEDQQGVSDVFGVGADYAAARKLVATRKGIEDQAIKLFGREVQGSILPKLTLSSRALTKGDLTKFKQLIDAVPPARRTEVVATMLNDLFTQGARSGQPLGQGFIKAFDGLNRNTGAKNLMFSHLPKDARIRFDKIGRVAKGIFRSKALENTSKTAGSLIAAMDDGGMFAKVYDVGRKAVIAEGVSTTVGLPGAGTGAVLGAALVKGRTPATQAADTFLTSKRFKNAVEEAARTGDATKADAILKKSPAFNRWKKFLSKEDAAKLATIGFIPYVTSTNIIKPDNHKNPTVIEEYIDKVLRGEFLQGNINRFAQAGRNVKLELAGKEPETDDNLMDFFGFGVIKDIRPPIWNKLKKSIPVGVNPGKAELKELLSSEETLRVIQQGDNTFVWPASDALHEDIARKFGLKLEAKTFGLTTADELGLPQPTIRRN